MCSKPIFCSKIALKGKTCSRLLKPQKVAPNAKSCSKVAEHNRDRPSWREVEGGRGRGGGGSSALKCIPVGISRKKKLQCSGGQKDKKTSDRALD